MTINVEYSAEVSYSLKIETQTITNIIDTERLF